MSVAPANQYGYIGAAKRKGKQTNKTKQTATNKQAKERTDFA